MLATAFLKSPTFDFGSNCIGSEGSPSWVHDESPVRGHGTKSPATVAQGTRDKTPLELKSSAQMTSYFVLQRCSVLLYIVVLLKL